MRAALSLAVVAAVVASLMVPVDADGKANKRKRIAITVTDAGFVPKRIEVAKDAPVTMVFTRKTDKTCATNVVIHVSEKEKIERDLPLGKAVAVDVRFATSGELTFACGMGHLGGVIRVQ